MERKVDQRLQSLWNRGVEVYSISKINSFNNCQYEYYNTYILKNRGKSNCYSEIGSVIHDSIEAIYKGEMRPEDIKKAYIDKMMELDLLGINFPSEKIKESFNADMSHFVNNFNKINSKMALEKFILFEPVEGVHMQGYIDAILPSEDKTVSILDWKTSSKFSGKKLTEAGRQLVMYKLGIENNTSYKVDKVGWFMVKYVYVCSRYKNGNIKRSMCNRGKWVKEVEKQIKKELYDLKMDEFEVEMLIDRAIECNNLDCLPKEVQDKFWLEDCIVWYDITDEEVNELKNYVKSTVNAIISKDKEDKNDWKAVEIDRQTSFYCSQLCGHSSICEYYKKFLDENMDSFGKKNKIDEFDIFS